jgi:predicted TIM-barrel fold metal-dependent hydrolase
MNRRTFNRKLVEWTAFGALAGLARAVTNSKPMLTAVDTHAHIFQRGLKFAEGRRYTPDYDATLEDYLHHLDSQGSSHGVLIQPSFLGTDNRYLLAALQKFPQRLRGIAVVDPASDAASLQTLATAGIAGIRFNLAGVPIPDFKAGPWPALLRAVAHLGWHVEVHREARDLPRIVGPLLDAGMNVVVDHFGRPDPQFGVEDAGFRYLLGTAASRRVWVKISAAYRNGANGRGEEIARAACPLLRAAFGRGRLLWGSDWPHTQFEKLVDPLAQRRLLDAWFGNEAERNTILQDTPQSLYRF